MHWIDFEDYLDKKYGPIGTPECDEFEVEAAEEMCQSQLREARKQARKAKLQNFVTPIVNVINKVADQPEVART